MAQISSSSLTIVDVTDGAPGLNNTTVFLYQRAVNAPSKPTGSLTYTFSTALVTGELEGWSQNLDELTGSNPIWMIAAVASSNGETDVIESSEWAGPIKMAQNGQDGLPGAPGTNGLNQATIFIYKRDDSATAPSSTTYTFATGGFTVPSGWSKTIPTEPKGKPCWVTSAIAIGAEATAELNWVAPSVLVEDGSDGVSPTVTATENGVKIVDADGNETFITNGADGTSYYTFVRYSKNANGSGYVATPTSETIYIGVYTGTKSSPPAYNDSGWTWSRYVGADGQPGTPGSQGPQGVSVASTRELYYLKTNSTDPAQITSANQIHTTDDVNQWTSIVPTYIGSGKYYTCIETTLSNGNVVWSAPVENKGLTDANVNAANAIEIARNVKQHFFWVATDKSENIPAGAYVAEQSEESFYSNPTKGNILTRSDGIWIRNGVDKLATLQGSGLTFLVPTGTYKGQKSVSLNGSGLTFYNIGSSNSAAATLASDGLQITNGSIILGTTGGTAAGNVTLSNKNFTRSINGTSHSDLRFAIGSKFGVASDGTLYASGANIININGENILANTITADKIAADAIVIGSTNLLRNGKLRKSGGNNGITFSSSAAGEEYIHIAGTATDAFDQWVAELTNLTVTDTAVTISSSNVFSEASNAYFYVTTSKNGAYYKAYNKITSYSSTQKYLTINLEDGETLRYLRLKAPSGFTVDAKFRFKVEVGNKQTAWSPAIEDLIPGGVNLVPVTHMFDGSGRTIPYTNVSYEKSTTGRGFVLCHTSDILESLVPTEIGVGEPIVLSFDFKLDSGGDTSHKISFYPYQSNGVSIAAGRELTSAEKTSSWKRITWSTNARRFQDNGTYCIGAVYIYDETGNNKFSVRNVQIERGYNPSEFTKASEDYGMNIINMSSEGIWVTPVGKQPTNTGDVTATTTGTKIDDDGVGIYVDGKRYAQYGTTTSFYNSAGTSVTTINADGLNIQAGTIDLGGGKFHVDKNGKLTSTSALIGGWTIDGNSFRKYGPEANVIKEQEDFSNNKIGSKYQAILYAPNTLNLSTNSAFAIAVQDCTAYNNNAPTYGTAYYPFRVKYDGSLIATKADISGKITASSGSIGGWNIGTDSLYHGNQTPGATTSNLVLSPNSAVNTTAIAGSETNKHWFISAGRSFGVDTSGKLYATGAEISGVVTVSSGSNVYTTDDTNPLLVGGRNLFGYGSECVSLGGFALSGTWDITTQDGYKCAHAAGALNGTKYLRSNLPFTPKPLETVTFSAWVKIKNVIPGDPDDGTTPFCTLYLGGQTIDGTWRGYSIVSCYVDDVLTNISSNQHFYAFIKDTKWHHVAITFRALNYTYTANLPPYIYFRDCTGDLYVRNIKFERGNKATDWTPAPEDATGTNLLTYPYVRNTLSGSPYTVYGITYTLNDNGTVTAKGTASGSNAWYQLTSSQYPNTPNGAFCLPAGVYTISGCPSGGSSTTYRLVLTAYSTSDGTTGLGIQGFDTGNGATITLTQSALVRFEIVVYNGYACPSAGITFKPMLEVGEAAHRFSSPSATSAAAESATKYITRTSDAGIRIHPASDTNKNSILLDGNGLKVYKGGTTSDYCIANFGETVTIGKTGAAGNRNVYIDSNWVQIRDNATVLAQFGSSVTIGKTGAAGNRNVYIDSNWVQIRDNATVLAQFGSSVTIGQESTRHIVIANEGMDVLTDTSTVMAHIGYGSGSSSSGTATAPYFTFGTREGDTVGNYSFASGVGCVASGYTSHAEGNYATASGNYSHAEGYHTTASVTASHAEGHYTTASGIYSHAEGGNTTASRSYSHAEGCDTTASGLYSHAEGYNTTASGNHSHAGGCGTKAQGPYQTVIGKYNIADTASLFIIGDGTEDIRRNALKVNLNGLFLKNHSSAIGTRVSARLGSAMSITAGTVASLCSIPLTTGKWVITAVTRFPNTSTATYRVLAIGTSDTDTQPIVQTAAINGYPTYLNATKIVEVTGDSQTYYLNVMAGTACSMPYGTVGTYNYIEAIRIE